jgi:hypothetical protein
MREMTSLQIVQAVSEGVPIDIPTADRTEQVSVFRDTTGTYKLCCHDA